jgi:transcriptional regulator with XRE-family HTH domain
MSGVGQEIKRLREARGWIQARLAVEAGMAPSAVNQIENGKRSPSANSLNKLAGALGVEVRELFPLGQAPLPLEGALALEASDDDFAEMVAEASEEHLAAMKRGLSEHLPKGGAQPLPVPTDRERLAIHRSIVIYQEQRKRAEVGEEQLQKQLVAVGSA